MEARLPQAVLLKFFNCLFDLVISEHARRSDLKGHRILFAERLDFDGKPHRLAQIRAGGNHAGSS
jgi:hypothetical protein